MKNRSRWLLTFCAFVAVVALLAGYKFLQIRAAIEFGKSFPEPSATVTAVLAQAGEFVTTTHVLGEIVAPQALELRNELAGTIAAVNFAAGDRVNKGDILLQLDVSEESASLKAAEARVKLAKLDLERFARLYEQKTVSAQQRDQAQAQFAIAEADVQGLKATIAKKTLRAPFNAITGLHNLEVGEFLQANTLIVSLVGVQGFTWVDFNLPMAHANLAVGSNVEVVIDDGAAARTAKVIAREPMASAASRNVRFRARLETDQQLAANRVVNVGVPLGRENRLVLPITAVQKDGMGDYVYVLNRSEGGKGYRAERRTVVVASRNDQQASIASGLAAGDLVADKGSFKLRAGLLTHVIAAQEFHDNAPGGEAVEAAQ